MGDRCRASTDAVLGDIHTAGGRALAMRINAPTH
jgi:hypothetical protein